MDLAEQVIDLERAAGPPRRDRAWLCGGQVGPLSRAERLADCDVEGGFGRAPIRSRRIRRRLRGDRREKTLGILSVNNWTIYCQQLYNPGDEPASRLSGGG